MWEYDERETGSRSHRSLQHAGLDFILVAVGNPWEVLSSRVIGLDLQFWEAPPHTM